MVYIDYHEPVYRTNFPKMGRTPRIREYLKEAIQSKIHARLPTKDEAILGAITHLPEQELAAVDQRGIVLPSHNETAETLQNGIIVDTTEPEVAHDKINTLTGRIGQLSTTAYHLKDSAMHRADVIVNEFLSRPHNALIAARPIRFNNPPPGTPFLSLPVEHPFGIENLFYPPFIGKLWSYCGRIHLVLDADEPMQYPITAQHKEVLLAKFSALIPFITMPRTADAKTFFENLPTIDAKTGEIDDHWYKSQGFKPLHYPAAHYL